MTQAKYFFFLILTVLSLESCKDTNEYRVNSEFEVYVQRFETEASARGRSFNIKSTGLIVEFANLKDNTAGLCHYEDPIRIEIDKTYWNAISKTAGADLMKEDLLFHELGHGLLGRKHLNDLLENGDWKSIMCGGDQVGDRPWNINYRGIRRSYYVDELFNEKGTDAPDFASTQLLADTTGYSTSMYLGFDSEAKKDAGFDIVDNATYKTSIDNSRLHFQSKTEKALLILGKTNIDIQSDFSFEISFDYPLGDTAGQYGLVFGNSADSVSGIAESLEYFTINNNQKMYIGNRNWYSYYTELSKDVINAEGKNILKVIKINSMLYYFVNDVYCYSTEIEAKNNGYLFGFMVPPMGDMWLDDFLISQRMTANMALKSKKNQPIGFEIIKIEPITQNKVLNK